MSPASLLAVGIVRSVSPAGFNQYGCRRAKNLHALKAKDGEGTSRARNTARIVAAVEGGESAGRKRQPSESWAFRATGRYSILHSSYVPVKTPMRTKALVSTPEPSAG